MKYMQFLLTACSLSMLLATSATAGPTNNCDNGVLVNKSVRSITVSEGKSCIIYQVTVSEGITAINADAVVISESDINGDIEVRNTKAVSIMENRVYDGSIVANDNDSVAVLDNQVHRGSILVNDNQKADVVQNQAGSAILCKGNNRVVARFNHANGEEACLRRND